MQMCCNYRVTTIVILKSDQLFIIPIVIRKFNWLSNTNDSLPSINDAMYQINLAP